MGRFSAITCDHCDARDIVDHPQKHDIKKVAIEITVDGNLIPMANSDLCGVCRNSLKDAVIAAITQVPGKA